MVVTLPVHCKLSEECIDKWGSLSVQSVSGMPCSAKSSFRIELLLEALHWDAGIFGTIGILQ